MTQHTPSPQEDAAQIRELALQLLAPFRESEEYEPQLLVGRISDSLPFELPLPDSSRVIGSFLREPETMLIVLETEQLPAAVIAFYKERMHAAGWSEPDALRRQKQSREGGFIHTFPTHQLHVTLCKGQRGPSLGVSASRGEREASKTSVKLNIDTRTRFSPCMQSSEIFVEVGNTIPALEPPQGGRQRRAGGGSDSESADIAAVLELKNDIALPVLAAHYARQLELAGWKRTGEGSSGPSAWYTWELRDKASERWLGVFTILQIQGVERQYYMQVHINWVSSVG